MQNIILSAKLMAKRNFSVHGRRLVFLSDNLQAHAEVQKLLGSHISLETLGKLFHQTAAHIESPFIQSCEAIAKTASPLVWWSTYTASRSSTAIPLYKETVFLFSALELVKQNPEQSFVFVIDSPPLGWALQQALPGSTLHITKSDRLHAYTYPIKWFAKIPYFFLKMLTKMLLARLFYLPTLPQTSDVPIIILRSWQVPESLSPSGEYHDRNFQKLPKWLQEQSYLVFILPIFLFRENPFHRYQKLSRANIPFLLPEKILNPFHLLKGFWLACKQASMQFQQIEVDGIDLSILFRHTNWQCSFNPELMELNLCYELLAELRKTPVSIKGLIYPLENNAIEKPFILGAKKYFPDAEVIGFQHSMWYHEQPAMKVMDPTIHPLPDRIICGGHRYCEVLKHCGFPAKTIHEGPSLRFDFSGITPNQAIKQSKMTTVLLILNYFTEHALQLIRYWQEITPQLPKHQVNIRPHPLNDQKLLQNAIDQTDGGQKADGKLLPWIQGADLVVIPGASVSAIEAILQNKPVIRFAPENDFFLDPLWNPYPIAVVSTPDELLAAVQTALDLKEPERSELDEFRRLVRGSYFNPVTDQAMRCFLPNPANPAN